MRATPRSAGIAREFIGFDGGDCPGFGQRSKQQELGEYQRENKGHAGGGGDCAAGDEREHAPGAGTGGSCAEWSGTADESSRSDGTAGDGGEPEYAAVYSGAQADRAPVLAGYGQGLYPPVPHVSESAQALYRDQLSGGAAGERSAAGPCVARRED